MIEDITPERIATSIMMKDIPAIIVEGTSDYNLFKKFTRANSVDITIALFKNNVIESIKILNEMGFDKALGIADKDFDDLLGKLELIPNLLYTDYHDFDMCLFMSPALEAVIDMLGQADKFETFSEECGSDVREYFLTTLKPLSILKLANHIDSLGIAFKPSRPEGKPLPFSNFIDDRKILFTGDQDLIDGVHNYSLDKSKGMKTKLEIYDSYSKIDSSTYTNYLQLTNGHDVIQLLCLSLKHKIGNMNSNLVKPKALQDSMILAYDSSFFSNTKLYAEIKDAEKIKGISFLLF